MADHLHLVFATPSPEVSDEAFNAWYRHHLSEILALRGWRSARRYALASIGTPRAPASFPYLALYEVDPDIAANMAALMEGRDERRANGPSFVATNRYASFNARPLGRGDVALDARLALALVAAPARADEGELDAWHEAAVATARANPAVRAAWRFSLEPTPFDEAHALEPLPALAAIYAIEGDFTPPEVDRRDGPGWVGDLVVSAALAIATTARVED